VRCGGIALMRWVYGMCGVAVACRLPASFTFTGLERQEVRLSDAYLASPRNLPLLSLHNFSLTLVRAGRYQAASILRDWGRSVCHCAPSPFPSTLSRQSSSVQVDLNWPCSQRLGLRYRRSLHSCRWGACCPEKRTRKRSCR
jgi:hypothetical protein